MVGVVSMLTAGAVVAGAGAAGADAPAGGTQTSPGEMTISFCHWTNGGHYNYLTTAVDVFYNAGHLDHHGNRDIYPAGSWTKPNGTTITWPQQGDQTVLANGCETPPAQDAEASATAHDNATCDRAGTVTFTTKHATWKDPDDTSDGERVAVAKDGHLFAGGEKELTVSYPIFAQKSGGACTSSTPRDASATAVALHDATCDGPGSVVFDVTNASWQDPRDETDGSRVAVADDGHLFANGEATLIVDYTVEPTKSGKKCAGPRPPAEVVKTPWVDQAWQCGATSTTQTRTVTRTRYVLGEDGLSWVLDTEHARSKTQTRTRHLKQDEVTQCTVEHDPYTTSGSTPTVDCAAFTVTVSSWTTRWVWDDVTGAYVGTTTTSDSERTPTAAECPAGEKPAPLVSQTEKTDLDCSALLATTTTTTTTTDWELNEDKTSWVKTAPEVSTAVTSVKASAQACPPQVEGVKHTAPPVAPIVKGVKYEAASTLPRTGSEAGLYGAAGLLLLMVGSGLVLVTRKRSVEGRAH
jgi:LPXTG-motif cell wall-anchored protein